MAADRAAPDTSAPDFLMLEAGVAFADLPGRQSGTLRREPVASLARSGCAMVESAGVTRAATRQESTALGRGESQPS